MTAAPVPCECYKHWMLLLLCYSRAQLSNGSTRFARVWRPRSRARQATTDDSTGQTTPLMQFCKHEDTCGACDMLTFVPNRRV